MFYEEEDNVMWEKLKNDEGKEGTFVCGQKYHIPLNQEIIQIYFNRNYERFMHHLIWKTYED